MPKKYSFTGGCDECFYLKESVEKLLTHQRNTNAAANMQKVRTVLNRFCSLLQQTFFILFASVSASILFLMPDLSFGQMFSMQDERNNRSAFSTSSFSIGWEYGDFTFQGDPGEAGSDRYDFDEGMFKIQFENPGFNLYFGTAGRLTGADEGSFLNIGAVIYNDFPLHRTQRLQVLLPLQLNTDLMRSQIDLSANQFQQSAFQIGAGLALKTDLSSRWKATARVVPNYGFSNSQGSFIGGSVFSFQGEARVYLLQLFGGSGLVAGYDFRYRNYDIDADLFDYKYQGHSLTIGITF